MSSNSEFLWYIPNDVKAGHRGDSSTENHNSLDTLTSHAKALEDHGWKGALVGTGWGRPDTFTIATALVARTTTFEPLIAIRPGYWRPANFASAAATLDHLSGGRVRVNIVSGQDNLAAYGDSEEIRRIVMPAPRNSCGWSAGCGPKRTSRSQASISRLPVDHRAAPPAPWQSQAPETLLRRRFGSRRAGGRDRGRCPALLG